MVKIALRPFELLASLSRVPHTTPARLGQHLGFAYQLVVPVKLAAATFPFTAAVICAPSQIAAMVAGFSNDRTAVRAANELWLCGLPD
jgi:hypothetical protein